VDVVPALSYPSLMLQNAHRFSWTRAAQRPLALLALVLLPSCFFTSSFEGLEGGSGGSTSSGTTSSSSSSGGGSSGDSTSSGSSSGEGTASGSSSSGEPEIPPIAFPKTAVLDEFELANGEIGAMWELASPGSYINEDRKFATTNPEPNAAIWSENFGPRQEVYVQLTSFTEADAELQLIIKNQGFSGECESILASYNNFNGSRVLTVSYCTKGEWYLLGAPIPLTLTPGDALGLRSYEDGTVELYRNTEKLGTYDAAVWEPSKGGGRIGIFAAGLAGKVTFDHFGGGTF
jgi:hypothetical protein